MRKLLLVAVGLAALTGAGGLALAQTQDQAAPNRGGYFQRFDTDGNSIVTRQEFDGVRAAEFARLDANRDGQISRDEMRAGFRQGASRHRGAGGRGGGMLARADTNHDGSITRAEFMAGPERMFGRLDKNSDGTVSAAELQQARADGQQRRQQMRANRPRLDANSDGLISRSEFDTFGASMFQRLDANGDGQVTQAEAAAARPHRGR